MALAWMLKCELSGTAQSAQGPAGSQSVAMIGIDLARNGLPAALQPPGNIGNLSTVSVLAYCLRACSTCQTPSIDKLRLDPK